MIVVHHLNDSRSQRILWLLEELGLPYEIRRYQRDAATMLAPPELRAVHPLGKSPVVTDGDVTVAESGAIIEYLVDQYGNGRLKPAAATEARRRYTYWLHYAEGSAMSPLLFKLVFDRIDATPMPFFAKPIARQITSKVQGRFIVPNLKLHLDYLESELAHADWFAGPEITAADIQLSFPIELARVRAGLDESRPRLMDFLRRIHARPAYQAALTRAGDYSLLR